MNRKILLSGIGLIFLIACSSSHITYSWRSDVSPSKKYNKILVLALNGENHVQARQQMENHLVGDLRNLGYNAVSAMNEYGPKTFRDMKEEAVVDKLQNSGIDAIITIVLLDKTKERHYVPGYIYYSPYVVYHRHFWGYYTTIYDRVYTPGYYVTNTRFFWEINLFDVGTKELLYTVQTESFDPASSESLAHEYGQLIVKDMVKKQVLNRQEAVVKNIH